MGSTPHSEVSAPQRAIRRQPPAVPSRRRLDPHDARRAGRHGRELLVVVNGRSSGAGEPEALLGRVTRRVAEAGSTAAGVVTTSEQDLARAMERAEGRRVVLVGGDGSLHAALNLPLPLPELAIVPSGRANNVARAFGIPASTEAAADIAVRGRARPVDVLRVAGKEGSLLCIEALSAGLQAAARHGYGGDNSSDVGAGARVLADALRRYRPYRVVLTEEGEPIFAGEAAQVFLANLPFFGFGFRVNPRANPFDGMLEAVVLRAATRREALVRLLTVHRGGHLERDWSLIRRVREARIEGPLPLVADSRPLGTGSATVSVVRDRLRLAAP